jgi:hypothetical protein
LLVYCLQHPRLRSACRAGESCDCAAQLSLGAFLRSLIGYIHAVATGGITAPSFRGLACRQAEAGDIGVSGVSQRGWLVLVQIFSFTVYFSG